MGANDQRAPCAIRAFDPKAKLGLCFFWRLHFYPRGPPNSTRFGGRVIMIITLDQLRRTCPTQKKCRTAREQNQACCVLGGNIESVAQGAGGGKKVEESKSAGKVDPLGTALGD